MTRTCRSEQFRAIRKAVCKRIDHFTPDFVTTRSSRNANRDSQVFGLRAVFIRQSLHTCDHRGSECATPTGVHGGKRTRARIANENRNAVSRFNSGEHSIRVADDHVAIDRLAKMILRGFCFFHRSDDTHVSAVNLPATGEGPLARKKLEKAAAILQNVLGPVIVKTGEAQRILWHVADATETRRETVYKTILLEWQANKRAQAVKLAPVETSFG